MPNLGEWIEAQLKKGYSVSQIKAVLHSRGYPSKAVAEVDKIAYTAPSAKTLPGKKIDRKLSYSLIFIIGAIVIGAAYFIFGGNQAKDTQINEAALQEISQPMLEPITTLSGNTSEPAEVYRGILSRISETSITLTDGSKTRDFLISKQNPPRFISGVKPNIGKAITPTIGDRVIALFLTKPQGQEPYVLKVVINDTQQK